MAYKLIALLGFLLFALSPSFIDWRQSPELHTQFVVYYLVASIFVFAGLDGWAKGT